MSDSFDLISVDWDTVRLLQAGQFKQETFYLEERTRWLAQRGRLVGLLHLADDGVGAPVPEGADRFSVSVRGCIGIAEHGGFVDVPDDAARAVRGSVEAPHAVVPLFLGVARTERTHEAQFHPSVDTGLLQCGGLRRPYALAATNADETYDWLQIAQWERTTTGFRPDPAFLPECLFLSSHAGVAALRDEITRLASQALDALEKNSTNNVAVYAAAAALAGSLGPAARSVDGRLHPRAYLDRLAGVLAAQRTQLTTLPNPNLGTYQDALDQLRATLDYLDGDWALGRALAMARDCFDRLLRLYPSLLQGLGVAGASSPPPVDARWDTFHQAPAPGGASRAPATHDGSAAAEPPPKRGSIWRR